MRAALCRRQSVRQPEPIPIHLSGPAFNFRDHFMHTTLLPSWKITSSFVAATCRRRGTLIMQRQRSNERPFAGRD